MRDDEIEQLIGRQRVAAPRPLLRARVLATATGEPRRVPLGLFDYGMLAIATGLVLVAAVIEVPATNSTESARRREIAEVAADLGGGPDAAQYAELVVTGDDDATDPLSMEAAW